MKTVISSRESQKVSELAADYKDKGYEVFLPTSPSESPAFLRSFEYVPDIIAHSKNENLIFEVKSRQSSHDLNQLSEIAELVNAQPGWQFVLVFTNPRKPLPVQTRSNTQKVRELLQKSRLLFSDEQANIEAAFLFAWVALEASLHLLPEGRKSVKKTPTTPWTMIRNAAMEGYIGRDDAEALDRFFKLRNSLLHAGNEASPSTKDVEELQKIVEYITNSITTLDF